MLGWDRPRHEPCVTGIPPGGRKTPNNGMVLGVILLIAGLLLAFYRIRFAVSGDVGEYGESAEDAWAALGMGAAVAGLLILVAFSFGGSRMRYALLLVIPVTSWWGAATLYTDLDPVGMITATIPFLIENDTGWVAGDFFAAKVVLTAFFFISAAMVSRFWCRFICPLGAFMSPFNKVSALHLRLDREACIECRKCEKTCPTRMPIIPPALKDMDEGDIPVRDTRCILCGRCADVCPTSALALDMGGKRWAGKGRPPKRPGTDKGAARGSRHGAKGRGRRADGGGGDGMERGSPDEDSSGGGGGE